MGCLCAKIIGLIFADPHLSSIDGGRGAPVGSMFQMEEKERRKARHFVLFPSGVRHDDEEISTAN